MASVVASTPQNPSLVVVCLEGCHGVGKTELVKLFERSQVEILDEGFLSMHSRLLHPQSLLMETAWVSACFQRIVERAENTTPGKPTIVISDRSPYSACFYAQNGGSLLEPIIDEHVRELTSVGVKVVTLCVSVEPSLLWKRIQARLEREPHRAVLHEDRREWMDQTLAFYNAPERNWDGSIDNSGDLATTAMACVQKISLVSKEAGEVLASHLATVVEMPSLPAAAGSKPARLPVLVDEREGKEAEDLPPSSETCASQEPVEKEASYESGAASAAAAGGSPGAMPRRRGKALAGSKPRAAAGKAGSRTDACMATGILADGL